MKTDKKNHKVIKTIPMTAEEKKLWAEHKDMCDDAMKDLKIVVEAFERLNKKTEKIKSHRKMLWGQTEMRLGIHDKCLDVDKKNWEIQVLDEVKKK